MYSEPERKTALGRVRSRDQFRARTPMENFVRQSTRCRSRDSNSRWTRGAYPLSSSNPQCPIQAEHLLQVVSHVLATTTYRGLISGLIPHDVLWTSNPRVLVRAHTLRPDLATPVRPGAGPAGQGVHRCLTCDKVEPRTASSGFWRTRTTRSGSETSCTTWPSACGCSSKISTRLTLT